MSAGDNLKSLTGGVWGVSATEHVIDDAERKLKIFLHQLPPEIQAKAARRLGRIAHEVAASAASSFEQIESD